MKEFIGRILVPIAIVCILMGLFIGGIKSLDEKQCYSFGQQSNRETHFVTYNFMSWDCLTPTKNGKQISTSMLRDIN